MLTTAFPLPTAQISEFCRRWKIARLELFGSALRDDFRPDSDVDFLYTPAPDFRRDLAYGPWGHDNLAEELSAILKREVDIIDRSLIEKTPNWIRRKHIIDTAQVVYESR